MALICMCASVDCAVHGCRRFRGRRVPSETGVPAVPFDRFFPPVRATGWECPRCGKIHAPHVSGCECRANPSLSNQTRMVG